MRPALRLVLQPGLYRSASTWASNVVAELLRLSGPASLHYADSAQAIAQEVGAASQVVIKTHMPDSGLPLLARLSRMPVLLTVRDPLDCIVSLMEQFHEPFERAAPAVVRSAGLMLAFLDACEPLVAHYETQARDAAAVARVAAHIGVDASGGQTAAIAERLSAKSVGAFIDELMASGYFGSDPKVHQHHRETHWHPRHLGSGVSGRHTRILSAEQIAAVDSATKAFRCAFGYLRAGEA